MKTIPPMFCIIMLLISCPHIMSMDKRQRAVFANFSVNLETTSEPRHNKRYVIIEKGHCPICYNIYDIKKNKLVTTLAHKPQLNVDIPSLVIYQNEDNSSTVYDLKHKKTVISFPYPPPRKFRKNINSISDSWTSAKLYDLETNKTYDLQFEEKIKPAIDSPDCSYLLFPLLDHSTSYYLFDVKKNSLSTIFICSTPTFSPNSQLLAYNNFNTYKINTYKINTNKIIILELATQKIVHEIQYKGYLHRPANNKLLEFSKDNTTLTYVLQGNTYKIIKLYNLKNKTSITISPQTTFFNYQVDPEMKIIAVNTDNNPILFFSTCTGKFITALSCFDTKYLLKKFTPQDQQALTLDIFLGVKDWSWSDYQFLYLHNIRNKTTIPLSSHYRPQFSELKHWIVFAPYKISNKTTLTIYDYLHKKTASLYFADPIKKFSIKEDENQLDLIVITEKQFLRYGKPSLEMLFHEPFLIALLAKLKKQTRLTDVKFNFTSNE